MLHSNDEKLTIHRLPSAVRCYGLTCTAIPTNRKRKVSRNECTRYELKQNRSLLASVILNSVIQHFARNACGISHAPDDRVTLTNRCELMALNNIDCVEEFRAFTNKFMISDVECILGIRA